MSRKNRDYDKTPAFTHDREKKHIEISLGMACNNKCMFCLNIGPRKVVPFDQVVREAGEYAAKGYNSIGLIGGDPTVYPRIGDLGRVLADLGYKFIHMISNGRRFHDMEFLDSMIEAGFNRFSVSIHSHLPEVEDKLTGRPGGQEQKVLGLRNLITRFNERAIRDRVAINIVMNKSNIGDLATSIRFFAGLGISDIRLLIIRPEGHARENAGVLVPRLTEVRERLPAVILAAHKRKLKLMMDPPPYCLFYDIPGFHRIVARDYIDFVIADDPDKAVRELFSWKEYRMREKVKETACGECTFEKICEGVWSGYVEIFGFDEFKPVSREMLSTISNAD